MFVNIGFGNYINSNQVVSVSRADSAPMKRLVATARDQGILVDVTQGRKTKSVITAMNGQVILSALMPETIADRCRPDQEEKGNREKPEEIEDE